ncbi:MAG: DUF1145 domain-containing protein [Porticoccaceae bacterium]|nr:DUF1145 domain-containing protein [Porticoccaceae bacterium]
MQMLLSIGKMSTIGLWVLPVLALIGFFSPEWNHNILWITVAVFFAHLGELIVIQGKLKMNDRDTIHDGLMVILAGFFHWLPIIKKAD